MQIRLDTHDMPDKLRLFIETPPPVIEIALGICSCAAKQTVTHGVTIDRIKEVVAGNYGLTLKDLASARRNNRLGPIRQLAMFIATEITNYSLPQIARAFGKRDHNIVMQARSAIQHQLKSDETYNNRVARIITICQHG
ncbi:MAG TPA: helix-turn-helix domain-containing protein [Candidatus Acidoferrales bacterium]|nr:helix-turn-helix domain-containing protein [Candidatus Acidoferrales bacterium]